MRGGKKEKEEPRLWEVDWPAFLAWLPAWEGLSPEARAGWLRAEPEREVPGPWVGPGRVELERAGLLATRRVKHGVRSTVPPAARGHLRLLRTLDAGRVFSDASDRAGLAYLASRFTPEEQSLLAHADPLARMERFLALPTPAEVARWERQSLAMAESTRLGSSAQAFAAAQRLVRLLAAHPAGLPLGEVPALLPGVDAATLGAVISGTLRQALTVAALRAEDHVPLIGLWPPVARHLLGPPPPPSPVEAAESFGTAWMLDDMTATLVELATEPVRLRGDGSLYARAAEALAARLLPLPAWTGEGLKLDPAATSRRLDEALGALQVLDLLTDEVDENERMRLAATAKGKAWLGRPERDRLRVVLDAVRASEERAPPYWPPGAVALRFFPMRISFEAPKSLDLRTPLSAAFLSLPREAMVPLRPFLDYHARSANPLLAAAVQRTLRSRLRGPFPGLAGWEQFWAEILAAFLEGRLAPLGGAVLGRTAEGEPCFALTDAGRYLLGGAKGFEYGGGAGEGGKVVVQPDFEVVFLASSPLAEAEVGRFAERRGTGAGATFRITRAAVLRAAEAGATAEEVLGTLERASATPLPQNVARQLRDWFAGVRRVRLSPAVLVECPDRDTAARVLSAAPKEVSAVAPTLLRLEDPSDKARAALAKRLRAQGIFTGP